MGSVHGTLSVRPEYKRRPSHRWYDIIKTDEIKKAWSGPTWMRIGSSDGFF
jgi:hypothetical protein